MRGDGLIRVIQGESGTVRAECLRRYHQADCAVWIEEGETPRSWMAVRRLVPRLRQLQGDAAVDAALAEHGVIAGLIFGGLRPALSAEQRAALDQLKAKPTSHLSHNWYLDRPVMHGAADLIAALVQGADVPVTYVVPNLSAAHPAAVALLVILYRRLPFALPDVLIGFDPQADTHRVDEHGLAWGQEAEKTREVLRVIQRFDGVELERLAANDAPESQPAPEFVPDRLDDDFDGRAFALLAGTEGPLDDEAADLVYAAAQRAFAVFSRDVAILLGLGLLATGTRLDRERQGRLHGLIGLSAHNWQFETEAGNPTLTETLEHHFQAALELEEDPRYRLAHLYRLAVTVGRRRKDFAAAIMHADRAVDEAATADVSRADHLYYEIWARNIRAYLHMRQGNLEGAFEDSNTGLKMVEELLSLRDDRDSRFTRTTLADNNLTLCKISGDEELLFDRVRANIRLLENDPESFGGRFSAGAWVQLFRERYRLDMAIRCAHFGLADAGHEYLQFRWYYLSQLGDLHYRRGEADEAIGLFEEAGELRRHFAPLHGRLFLAPTLAALRAGQLDRVLGDLAAALDHSAAADPSVRSEVLGLRALTEAYLGEGERAEETINQAIDLAVEGGVRDAMMLAALNAGRVARRLGRADNAAQAYRQGLSLSEVDDAEEPPAGLVLAMLVGLLDLEAGDGVELRRALSLVPTAFYSDAEVWWHLPVLLGHVIPALDNGLGSDAGAEREALAVLSTAAAQRPDCSRLAGALDARLPESVHHQELVI